MNGPFLTQLPRMSSDFEQFKHLTLTRQSLKSFCGKKLESGVLEEILGYALVVYYSVI